MMKHLFFSFLLTFCFVSCGKVLSCSPEINKWANENLAFYESAPRETIVSLPMSRQRAIYEGLPSERKVELWHAKMQMVKESGALSEDEFRDYSKVFEFLTPSHYEREKDRVALQDFVREWENIMRTEHSWDDEKLFEYSHIWTTREEFLKAIVCDNVLTKSLVQPGLPAETICECIYSVYCATSGLGRECSKNPPCKSGSASCGVVGSSNCNGTCQ